MYPCTGNGFVVRVTDETFTPAEASAFSEIPVRRVHKELEHRIIDAATSPPRLSFSALVYLRALELIGLELPVQDRAEIYRLVAEAVRSAAVSVQFARLLTLDVKPVVDELEDKVTRFQRWKKKLVTSDDIMGGEPVFPKRRLTVRRVGEMLERGESPDVVIEDYPYLTAEDLEFARLFVRAYPRVGRPPSTRQAAR
jgi:uncharacterized protein (DUF433 family)